MEGLDAIGKAVDIAMAASRGKIKDPTGGVLLFRFRLSFPVLRDFVSMSVHLQQEPRCLSW